MSGYSNILEEARSLIVGLPLKEVIDSGLIVSRVSENPEAARYFLMFADWGKISYENIFSQMDYYTASNTQVYVDLPFCKKFCTFCAFYGVVPRNYDQMARYAKSLIKEINLIKGTYFTNGIKADALELGGGTPTFLPLELLKDIVECLNNELPFLEGHEFNFEASPETVTGQEGLEKLYYLKNAGANRMSLGIQSFVNRILEVSNRPHNLDDVLSSLENIKKVGFKRLNVDLMVGLNGQSVEDFIYSVDKAIESGFDIIELYVMRYFDTKYFVPLKNEFKEDNDFLSSDELLLSRVAADILLRNNGYESFNGRTYQKINKEYDFYADYYKGNFSGFNTLGIGRKSNSNIYPWQYANYRNIDKYNTAIDSGRLPIACGTRFTDKARAAKILTGMFQLPGAIDYNFVKEKYFKGESCPFDKMIEYFVSLDLVYRVQGGYKKTFLGFLFIEEMLKRIYDIAVTPFSVNSLFLGRKQCS